MTAREEFPMLARVADLPDYLEVAKEAKGALDRIDALHEALRMAKALYEHDR